MKETFETYAERYSQFWEQEDKPCHSALNFQDQPREQRLKILGRAIWFYKLFWQLRKKFDVQKGFARYEPILNLLDEEKTGLAQNASSAEIADHVLSFEAKIQTAYGTSRNLSAASKLLWLKFRHPFIIYDEQARAALDTKRLDIRTYCEKWRSEYARHESAIQRASENFCSEPWFQERVFDNYLWTKAGDYLKG